MTWHMFTPPARADRIRALGPVAALPPALQRAVDEQGSDPIPRPGSRDWLASHTEPGQSFAAFLAAHPAALHPERRTRYLQPFDHLDAGREPPLDLLSRFAAAFFTLPIAALPVVGRRRRPTASQATSTATPGRGKPAGSPPSCTTSSEAR